jgi:uncharacterized membrane protein YtjA (UPF0391 family)
MTSADGCILISLSLHCFGWREYPRCFSGALPDPEVNGRALQLADSIHFSKGGETLLGWAVTFLIIAIIAAILGFGGIAAASAGIAKFLFLLFLVMFIIFAIFGWRGRGVP